VGCGDGNEVEVDGTAPEDVFVGAVSGVETLGIGCIVAATLDDASLVDGVLGLTLARDGVVRALLGDTLYDDVLLVWISALIPRPPPTNSIEATAKTTRRLLNNAENCLAMVFIVVPHMPSVRYTRSQLNRPCYYRTMKVQASQAPFQH
jgi:hypothetical protein